MFKNYSNHQRKQAGFTFVEIMTTTAIIGALVAIAVPNYLRIRMDVNMEMVRQHLKSVHQSMNDIMNQNQEFPTDINSLGPSEAEISVAAGLFAIDQKGYTRNGYQTFLNRRDYEFRTCPKEAQWNIAGDRCFTVNALGVTSEGVIAVSPWDARRINMNLIPGAGGRFNGAVLTDPNSNDIERIQHIINVLLSNIGGKGLLEKDHEFKNAELDLPCGSGCKEAEVISSMFESQGDTEDWQITKAQHDKMISLFPEVNQQLKSIGIDSFLMAYDDSSAIKRRMVSSGITVTHQGEIPHAFEIGVRVNEPNTTEAEYQALSKRIDSLVYDAPVKSSPTEPLVNTASAAASAGMMSVGNDFVNPHHKTKQSTPEHKTNDSKVIISDDPWGDHGSLPNKYPFKYVPKAK